MTAFTVLKFVIGCMPTLLKVAQYVMAAGKELAGKPGKEKLDWVMERLKVELPKLDSNQLYDWINTVVYMLRSMGKPT